MTLSDLARPFRVPAALLRGRECSMSHLIASAPLFRVEPQSPSPTLCCTKRTSRSEAACGGMLAEAISVTDLTLCPAQYKPAALLARSNLRGAKPFHFLLKNS